MSALEDAALARRCANRAGKALVAARARPGRDLGARGDALAHRMILDDLYTARRGDTVLSEEAADDPTRLDADRVWIVDLLDSTREYEKPGSAEWVVHVALWTRAAGLVTGAVALPDRGVTLGADRPPVPPPPADRMRIAVSRSRPPAVAVHLAEVFDAVLVPLGSAGYKAAAVLLGDVDAHVHAGGQYQWDSAAPVAVARGAGLHASRLHGAPLRYNVADLYLPDLLICRRSWRMRS